MSGDRQEAPPSLFIHAYLYAWVCAPVRILEPQQLLNTIPGVRAVALEPGQPLELECPEDKKVFIWQRAVLYNRLEFLAIQKELVRRGYLILADFDDDPDFFVELRLQGYITFTTCHGVQTTTEPLAEELRRFHRHVQPFPNQLAHLPPPRVYPPDGPVTIFFGAQNRQPDVAALIPVINRLLAKYRDRIRMLVVWDQRFFDALQTPHKEFVKFFPYDQYQEVLGRSDIALLPLNPTRFNSLKSDVKFLDCAGRGATVLASPTVYENSVHHGETGLLFHNLKEFESHLVRLIEDNEFRHRLAENAYRNVGQSRLLAQHIRKRYDWYLEMLNRLPQLNAELRERAPELFEP